MKLNFRDSLSLIPPHVSLQTYSSWDRNSWKITGKMLAWQYGFTDEELDFIIHYVIKYRLGKDAESGRDAEIDGEEGEGE